jgi:hypothetical protein
VKVSGDLTGSCLLCRIFVYGAYQRKTSGFLGLSSLQKTHRLSFVLLMVK